MNSYEDRTLAPADVMTLLVLHRARLCLNVAYVSFESRTCVRLQGISASLYDQPKQMFVYAFYRR